MRPTARTSDRITACRVSRAPGGARFAVLGTGRRGFTLVEAMLAVILASIVFGGAIQFYRMGAMSVVKTSDHAQARMEAMKVLEKIREDLDRLVVDDDLANLVVPVKLSDKVPGKEQYRKIEFFALHHRDLDKSSKKMRLIARQMTWTSQKLTAPQTGAVVMRNGEKFAYSGIGSVGPVTDLTFSPLSREEFCEMQISPYHALWVRVYPRGAWDAFNKGLASEANAQARLMHLSHIESQYACMLTLRYSNPPAGVFKNLNMLDDPFVTFNCPIKTIPKELPLDWVRPLGLVEYDKAAPFKDDDADLDTEH